MELQLCGDLHGLKVVVCEKINKENGVFHISNNIWNGDSEEMNDAIEYLNQIFDVYAVPRLGLMTWIMQYLYIIQHRTGHYQYFGQKTRIGNHYLNVKILQPYEI